MKQKGKVMKQSSAILKFLVVLGILTFGLVAGVPAQGFGLQRQHRVPPPPILPPIILTNPIIQPGRPILPMPIVPPVQPTNIHPILPTNTFPPIVLLPNCTRAPVGLVGWWKGDGNTLDSSGLGNSGVAINTGYTNGIVGQAFACDPNSFPYGTYTGIQIPDQPAYVLTNSLSIEGWVRPRGDGYSIFWRGDNRPGLDPYFLSMQGNNNLRFYIEDESGNSAMVGTYLTYNQWTHVAATLDGSTGTMSIYTNGVLADQTVTGVRPFGNLIPGDSPGVGIGNVNDGFNNFPFAGDIDEISLYNRALSANEIASLYHAGSAGKCPVTAPTCVSPPSGLISWWPGDGNANDIVGPNNGHLTNDISFTNGEVNLAFSMGTNGFVFVPASPPLDVGQGPGFTIEGWIYPTAISASAPNPIVEWSQDGGVYAGQQFYVSSTLLDSPGCLFAGFIESNNASAGDWFTSAADIVTNNGFQHVALTYNHATGDAAMYLNGVMVASKHVNVIVPWTTGNVLIGRRININDPSQNFHFAGREDEISLYNRALTAAEIQSIYNAGTVGKCVGPFPPAITVPPVNQTSVAGSNIILSVVANGTGPCGYQWSFNGTNILGATNATLTLTNLHPNQSGSYAVTITTPYGTITSSGAIVTVIARNILVYKYSGAEKITTAGQTFSYGYSGQMFFTPDNTNGTFVGWGTIKGKNQCWVNPLSDYLLITIPGASNQTFTVLGQAGQGIDTNGCPHIWSYLHKGKNTPLTIGQKIYFSFPNTFAADATHVYPDSQTGNMVLSESSSTYTFVPQSTQTANNTGQTMTDLVNALTQSLAKQGYQTQ